MSISHKLLGINSNWTATPSREGWKHYRIAARRYNEGELLVEMMAVCDRSVRFWVAAHLLKEGAGWRPGWD